MATTRSRRSLAHAVATLVLATTVCNVAVAGLSLPPDVDQCALCVGGFGEVIEAIESGKVSDHTLLSIAVGICDGLEIFDHELCYGVVHEQYGPLFLKNLRAMKPEHRNAGNMCRWLHICDATEEVLADASVHSHVPQEPQPLLTSMELAKVHAENQQRLADGKILRILHLTDIHPDIYYTAGAAATCKKPICCREASKGSGAAGTIGSYQCDLPMSTIRASLEWAAENLKPDVIVWTGDTSSHDVWDYSWKENQQALETVSSILHKAFPKTPVFPVFGNHEAVPCDHFMPPGEDNDQGHMYKYVADAWKSWLGDSYQSFQDQMGFWTKLIHPGLRYVGYNSMLGGDVYDSWMFPYIGAERYDPGNQIDWLQGAFESARRAKEKVILAAHIPVGEGFCPGVFCSQVAKLIDQYHDVVTVFLGGHTHSDVIHMVHDTHTGTGNTPLVPVFMPGSLTTETNLNPNMRIWDYDLEKHRIAEGHQYYMDMDKANKEGKIDWSLAYQFTEAYNVADLSAASVRNLAEVVRTDEAMACRYSNNRASQHAHRTTCDAACRTSLYCEIISATREEILKCRHQHTHSVLVDLLAAP